MNDFVAALRQFLMSIRLWVTVTPWEQAIRVRLGRRVKLLHSGVHLKIPFADIVFLQSVRMRITQLPRQTVSTADGKVVTIIGAIGYSIADIEQLYKTLHHPEDTISNLAQAAIAGYISANPLGSSSPATIQDALRGFDLSRYGISSVEIYVTDFAAARTYRVLGDYGNYAWGSKLTTDQKHDGRN